jgi:hypothetical protein
MWRIWSKLPPLTLTLSPFRPRAGRGEGKNQLTLPAYFSRSAHGSSPYLPFHSL